MANNETVPTPSLDNQTHNHDYVVGGSGDIRHKGSYYDSYKKIKRRVLLGLGAVATTAAVGLAAVVGVGTYKAVKSGEELFSSLDEGIDYAMESMGNALDKLLNAEPDYDAIAADANIRMRELLKLEVLEGQVTGVTRALKDDPKGFWNKLNGQWEQGTGVGTIIGKVNLGDPAEQTNSYSDVRNTDPRNVFVTHLGEGNMRITVEPEAIEYELENFDFAYPPIYFEQQFGQWQRVVPEMLGIADERSLQLDGTLRDYIEAEMLQECSKIMDGEMPIAITNALTRLVDFLGNSGAKSVDVVIGERVLPTDVDKNALRDMAQNNGYSNPDQISAMIPEGGEGGCVEVNDDDLSSLSPSQETQGEG